MPIKFLANHNTIIFGMSGVGKTTFMLEVLKQKLIHPMPKLVFYMYKTKQKFMETLNDEIRDLSITFIEGLNFESLENISEPSVLIIDDLLLSTDKKVCEQFIVDSHHKKISTFYLTQNLFPKNENFRTMSLNAHYFVLFKNQRSFRQIITLAHQVYSGKDVDRIKNAYIYCMGQERGFIVLCFTSILPPELTVITDYFSKCPSVWL